MVDGRRRQRRHVAAAAGGGEPKGNLGDELLDFMCKPSSAVLAVSLHFGLITASQQGQTLPAALHASLSAADAGKKLRKWYGQEGQVLPRDGRPGPSDQQEEEEEPAVREYIAVLDADSSPMAEQVGGSSL